MRNFGTLYRFELKKLWHRKMIWIALAILTAAAVLIPVGAVTGKVRVSGGTDQVYSLYEIVQRQRTDPAGLEGRVLDTDLIQEAIEKMGVLSRTTITVIGSDNAEASVTVRQADPDELVRTLDGYVVQWEYGDIWNTVETAVGQENMTEDLTGEDYYAALDEARQQAYTVRGLSDGARAWWDAQAEKLERPLTITGYPAGGWCSLAEAAFVVNLFIFLFAIIALSGLFPLESQRRTDALLQCARNGGTPLYAAKLMTGLTVSFCGGLITLGSTAAGCLILLGPEDAATAVQQLMYPAYGAPMTVRQLALTVCGIYLAASLIHAAFVMAVGLLTRGGTSAMAVCFGTMMLFIMVPALPMSHPWLSQLWSLLPTVFGANGVLADPRLVHLGGYLTNFQAAPLLWLVLTLALAALAWLLHRRVPNK